MKFQGPKWLYDPGTVVRSLIDPEMAEKTVPPCLARLDKPDCTLCRRLWPKHPKVGFERRSHHRQSPKKRACTKTESEIQQQLDHPLWPQYYSCLEAEWTSGVDNLKPEPDEDAGKPFWAVEEREQPPGDEQERRDCSEQHHRRGGRSAGESLQLWKWSIPGENRTAHHLFLTI